METTSPRGPAVTPGYSRQVLRPPVKPSTSAVVFALNAPMYVAPAVPFDPSESA